MKWTPAFLALIGFALAGCEKSTTQGPQGKKLTIYKPADQTLVRGETNEIAITIARTNFDAPIRIKIDGLPKGVEISGLREFASSESRLNLVLHASADADLVENHVVKVTVEGPDQMAAAETFQLTVKDKSVP